MKKRLNIQPARTLPVILALIVIYALASVAAAQSFAQLAASVSR